MHDHDYMTANTSINEISSSLFSDFNRSHSVDAANGVEVFMKIYAPIT